MKLRPASSTLILLLLSAATALAARPLEEIKSTTDKIISILNDTSLQGEENRQERHQKLRNELEQHFNWVSICRSCLARHWSKLSAAEQKEFIDLFKQFLERTYLDRIEPYYNQLDKIDYLGERIIENNYASVRSVITTKQKIDHPVEYRLEKSSAGAWLVYDVVIEGVSLVKNYRTQFDEIISKSSYQGLVNDLKAKAAEGKGL